MFKPFHLKIKEINLVNYNLYKWKLSISFFFFYDILHGQMAMFVVPNLHTDLCLLYVGEKAAM